MQLHIINQTTKLDLAHSMIGAEDSVIFIEDGVYCLLNSAAMAEMPGKLYALLDDLQLRGITKHKAQVVDIKEFVKLSLTAQHCVSW